MDTLITNDSNYLDTIFIKKFQLPGYNNYKQLHLPEYNNYKQFEQPGYNNLKQFQLPGYNIHQNIPSIWINIHQTIPTTWIQYSSNNSIYLDIISIQQFQLTEYNNYKQLQKPGYKN